MIKFRARAKPRARGEPPYNQWTYDEGKAEKARDGPLLPESWLPNRRVTIHLRE